MAILVPSRQRCREGGEYYVVKSPTPGTGIATAAAPTGYVQTAPFLLVKNRDTLGQGLSFVPDYVKLICTAAGTAGASSHLTVTLEADERGDKWTSGGSLLAGEGASPGAVAASSRNGSPPPLEVRCGALVTVAAAEVRKVSETVFRPVIPVVGDTYELVFGVEGIGSAGTTLNGTTPGHVVHHAPGVEVGPHWVLAAYLWLPAQSAACSFEVEVGGWMVPAG